MGFGSVLGELSQSGKFCGFDFSPVGRICKSRSFSLTFDKSRKHHDHDQSDHLGKIGGKELKDEGERGLGVDDVVQSHDVGVP